MTPPPLPLHLTKYDTLLLAGFAFTGLIVSLTVVPFVELLVKEQQLSNNTRVPFPSLPVIKNPPIDECAHNRNQTLDSGIICLPQDQKLMEKYLDGQQHKQI